MNTTSQKRQKRKYVKKSLLTQDELWKIIIPALWIPFVHFCLEDWVDSIDFTRDPVFLDKELRRLKPRGKAKNRAVDILMRIYLKNGTSKCFLLHIEVQGYYDENFEQRVFEYYYRITDLLQEPIETVAILIDDDPNWRPNSYSKSLGQTTLDFKFRLFKLLDNPPPYLNKKDNPFSIVFEVAWYALKQNMLKNDDDLAVLKFGLIRRLLANEVEEAVIYDLLDFINIYLPFENSEKETNFEREIDFLIDKDSAMPTVESYRERLREMYREKVRQDERKVARKEVRKEVREEFKKERQELRKERQEQAQLRQEAEKTLQEQAQLRQEAEKTLQEQAQLRQEAEKTLQEQAQLRQEAVKKREEEAKLRQEEAKLRQEEAKLRQEEAQKHAEKLLSIVLRLHKHGSSVETIADIVAEPIEAVQAIIDAQNV
jgi:hypothetical protein